MSAPSVPKPQLPCITAIPTLGTVDGNGCDFGGGAQGADTEVRPYGVGTFAGNGCDFGGGADGADTEVRPTTPNQNLATNSSPQIAGSLVMPVRLLKSMPLRMITSSVMLRPKRANSYFAALKV